MTVIKQVIMEASSFLREQGLDFPREEAELMLSFLLRQERFYLFVHDEGKELPGQLEEDYWKIVKRRGEGKPLAYITGKKEFMGLNFCVDHSVLIPRPETEHLVEGVIGWFKKYFHREEGGELFLILDLGTGCGNIALSLAHYLPGTYVVGVDVSETAIAIAVSNAEELGLQDRVNFLSGDYWLALSRERQKFHAIVSNPPYIPTGMLKGLPAEVQQEPRVALDGGADGLGAYRKIFCDVRRYLLPSGFLALEVGEGQAASVLEMGRRVGFERKNEIIKDYAGIERVVLLA